MRKPTGQGPQQRPTRTYVGMTVFVVVAFAVGLLLGWNQSAAQVTAQPTPAAAPAAQPSLPPAPEPSPEYSQRVVAYIYGNIPITREELGEYLIARYGAEKLELLVNKRIIEKVCQEKGVTVSSEEIEAELEKDCVQIGVTKEIFADKVLKERKVTLYEWKEDVLKPRLLLAKLCRDRVQVTEEDLRKRFEFHYGEKVEVRIILYPKTPEHQRILGKLYEQIRSSDDEFIKAAREQPDPNLAMTAGQIKPIARYSGADQVEKAAFRLQPGDVSELVETPAGFVVMKCLKRIPPDRTKIFENEREALKREVLDKKVQEEIPKFFAELNKQADAKLFLKKAESMADLKRAIETQDPATANMIREPSKARPGN